MYGVTKAFSVSVKLGTLMGVSLQRINRKALSEKYPFCFETPPPPPPIKFNTPEYV